MVAREDTVLVITTEASKVILHSGSQVTPSGQLGVVEALITAEVAEDEEEELIAEPQALIQIPRGQDLTSSEDLPSNLASR